MAPQVIRSFLASAGLIVLLPTGVLAQGPSEPATLPAQTTLSKSNSSAKDVPGGVSFCFGNTHIGQGARMTVRVVTNDRHYSFDSFGIQDAPFPTTTVTVSGSYWSFVAGAGFGW